MPITEGTNVAPVDNAGTKIAPLYDGVSAFFLIRRATAAILAAFRAESAQLVALPGEWPLNAAPAANTVASVTKAAGGAGVRHVLKSISAAVGAVAVPAATISTLQVRDGASGVGPVIWQTYIGVEAVAGKSNPRDIVGLNIVGSANTAMTVEFAAASGANTFQSISATGFDAA